MKLRNIAGVLVAALVLVSSLAAHEASKIKAPNGGRIIASVEPHIEFLLMKDRKVQLTFLNDKGKVVPPGDQVVTVTTGERSSPTKLSFKKSGNTLISDGTVPSGSNFATVVQIQSTANAKPATARFNLNLSECSGCDLLEYACTCGH